MLTAPKIHVSGFLPADEVARLRQGCVLGGAEVSFGPPMGADDPPPEGAEIFTARWPSSIAGRGKVVVIPAPTFDHDKGFWTQWIRGLLR